jgi:hypothetical protein
MAPWNSESPLSLSVFLSFSMFLRLQLSADFLVVCGCFSASL